MILIWFILFMIAAFITGMIHASLTYSERMIKSIQAAKSKES